MKKLVLILLVIGASAGFTLAQKYAYVDTQYILGNIPSVKGSDHSIVYFAFIFSPGWLRFSLTGSFA